MRYLFTHYQIEGTAERCRFGAVRRYNKLHGIYIRYNNSSKILQRIHNYRYNQLNGFVVQFNHKCLIMNETFYKNGKRHGPDIEYHTNNRLKFIQNFRDGYVHGMDIEYSYKCTLVRYIRYYIYEIILVSMEFYRNNKLLSYSKLKY